MKVQLIDTTLRDGEQAPGISFSNTQKYKIVEKLIDLGINEIEAGIPIMGKEEFSFVKSLNRYKKDINISAWSRFNLSDIKKVYETGVDIIHISVPTSNYHLPNQLGSWDVVLSKLTDILDYSKKHFKYVSIGIQDSFRSDPNRVLELCNIAEQNSLYRVRFSDTVGSSTPAEVSSFIKMYRGVFTGLLDFHGHNDLGLATANSLAALEAGADSVNVTVNGIGERAGNCSLEQIAFILDMHKKIKSNLKIERIKELSQMVSEFTKREIPPDKPIVGRNVFTHESGIHCHGMLKNPLAYQPFCPEDKGLAKSKLVVGKHSGRSNVLKILGSAGIETKSGEIKKIMHKFKKMASIKNDYLTTEEVINIFNKEHLGGSYE